MADRSSTVPTNDENSVAFPADKGKGKSAAPEEEDVSMMDEDDEEEDSEPEAGVSSNCEAGGVDLSVLTNWTSG